MQVLKYADYDGVSILYDAASIARRYGARSEAFDYSVNEDLCKLMNAHEAAAFGTQDGGEFFAQILLEGPAVGLDCGVLDTSGPLVLAGWHSFTLACDCDQGVLEAHWNGTFEVPAGRYRVFVERNFDEQGVAISLRAIGDEVAPHFEAVPGSDDYF